MASNSNTKNNNWERFVKRNPQFHIKQDKMFIPCYLEARVNITREADLPYVNEHNRLFNELSKTQNLMNLVQSSINNMKFKAQQPTCDQQHKNWLFSRIIEFNEEVQKYATQHAVLEHMLREHMKNAPLSEEDKEQDRRAQLEGEMASLMQSINDLMGKMQTTRGFQGDNNDNDATQLKHLIDLYQNMQKELSQLPYPA